MLSISTVLIIILGISVNSIFAQQNYDIPSWVKGVAGFWAEGKITDNEFGEGISFLISSEIIKIPEIKSLQDQNSLLEMELQNMKGDFEFLEKENAKLRSDTSSKTSDLVYDSLRVDYNRLVSDYNKQIHKFGDLYDDYNKLYNEYNVLYDEYLYYYNLAKSNTGKYYTPPSRESTPAPRETTPAPSATSSQCSGSARCFSGKVTEINDGDTIHVDGQSIRFALINAPEYGEYGFWEAKSVIEGICPVGSTALVDEDDGQTQGSYGRILGVVFCNDKNLSEAVLDSGHASLSTGFCSASEFSSHAWAKRHGC